MLKQVQESLQDLTCFDEIGAPVTSSTAPGDQYHLERLNLTPKEIEWSEFAQYQRDLTRAQACYLKLQGTRAAEQEALEKAQKAHEAVQKTLEARKIQEAEMQNEQASVARSAETCRRVRRERITAEAERAELYRRQLRTKHRHQREATERMYEAYLPQGSKQEIQRTFIGALKTSRSIMQVQKRVLLVSFKLSSAALECIKKESEALAEAGRKRKRVEEAADVNQTEKEQKMKA